ncbi:hypothetical protein Trydic_g2033 [Trypoxylus dichotomus]
MAHTQLKTYHDCFLPKKSTSCLPKLPPNVSWTKRVWRKFRRHLLVSEYHDSTKFHFRSTAAILAERKRQTQRYPSYIIHPFSMFCYYKEIVLFFVFCSTFLLSPISNTFLLQASFVGASSGVQTMNFCTDLLIMVNIGMCFISGYLEHETKSIVLAPKKIAVNYLKCYFWADLIGACPVIYFVPDLKTSIIQLLFIPKHLIFYPRVLSMLQYFRHITMLLHVSDAQHEIIRMIVLSLFILHWGSCLLYAVQYVYFITGYADGSWMFHANIHPAQSKLLSNVTLKQKYIWCLHMAMCHFYRISYGIYDTHSTGDYIALAIIMIIGAIYYSYIIVIVLQAIGTANASESKYEELMRQIYHYLRFKKMPMYINLRLQMYYEYRYQKRYFREQSIMLTLSEHLIYEIKLCTSRHLIGKVAIFKGLSKSIIGSIIGGLTLDIYLANDVIIQSGEPVEHWYLVSYGTVAIIHYSGAEISHLQDGECFGETNIIAGAQDTSVVAIEISEIFSMPKNDFLRYLSNETIKKRIDDLIRQRQATMKINLERFRLRHEERQEVLYKVRSGKILEQGRRRL